MTWADQHQSCSVKLIAAEEDLNTFKLSIGAQAYTDCFNAHHRDRGLGNRPDREPPADLLATYNQLVERREQAVRELNAFEHKLKQALNQLAEQLLPGLSAFVVIRHQTDDAWFDIGPGYEKAAELLDQAQVCLV